MAALITKPSLVEAAGTKFLIIDAPREQNLHLYLKEFKKYNVKHLVRIDVTPPGYNGEDVEKAGITMHEMFFEDGASPPADIIAKWGSLISSTFDSLKPGDEVPCIAVHCIAGLGRAPVLVAIAMIEHGIDAISAVTLIRDKRRGAINAVQLSYLEQYSPSNGKGKKKCTIM